MDKIKPIKDPPQLVNKKRAGSMDLSSFGACEKAYSRPAIEAKIPEMVIPTYAGICHQIEILLNEARLTSGPINSAFGYVWKDEIIKNWDCSNQEKTIDNIKLTCLKPA
ncbi:hypothetical protein BB559_003150 [Furculomyces boomerangus]|uniref:Uncharacterized protein n=1 Tax=Furculomyces boomerangus TaxID=61424 RepID=A0A2T9YNB0_9FUNG|nr:hypothetical protein BB559_003150 [Furculomyces boomerangus]